MTAQPDAEPALVASVPAARREPIELPRSLAALLCILIIAVGALARLVGTNWDDGANLHPDERHMMFVVMDTMRALEEAKPGDLSFGETWFAAGRSPLDPRRDGKLYVYGELPHIVVSLASRFLGGGWPEILKRARLIGAVIDAYTILGVFLLTAAATRSSMASLVSAGLYAALPMAIQQSNFFAVDIWLVAATTWCLVASTMIVRASGDRAALAWTVVAGMLAGLAFACKLPGAALIGAVGLAVLIRHARTSLRPSAALFATLLTALLSAAVAYRLASPFTFQGPGFFGLSLTEGFVNGYVDMRNLVLDFGFPPNWQWIGSYGRLDAVRDLLLVAVGVPTTLAMIAGFVVAARRRDLWLYLLPAVVTGGVLLGYWLANPIPALRYAAPATPVICMLAGLAVLAFRRTAVAAVATLVGLTTAAAWGHGVAKLHSSTNSIVAASRWIWLTTPPGTVVAHESPWDTGIPVPVRLPGIKDHAWPDRDKHFSYINLHVEYPDSVEKARALAGTLAKADFFTRSSERMRKPILDLADRFPMTTAFYSMLADGSLCYEPSYRSNAGYPFLAMMIDDSWVQEPWNVYDHPTVVIYRKLPCYDRNAIEKKLIQALPRG